MLSITWTTETTGVDGIAPSAPHPREEQTMKTRPSLIESEKLDRYLEEHGNGNCDICVLLDLVVNLCETALTHPDRKLRSGWLFSEPSFIRSCCFLRHAEHLPVTDTERCKTSWMRLRELIATHSTLLELPERTMHTIYNRRIGADAVSDGAFNVSAGVSVFEYCKQVALCVYPHEVEKVVFWYERCCLFDIAGARSLETRNERKLKAEATALSGIQEGVSYLVEESVRKHNKSVRTGKESQAKGKYPDRDDAKRNVAVACARVDKILKTAEAQKEKKKTIDACREVIARFHKLNPSKKEHEGKQYLYLMNSEGKRYAPESLAREYRKWKKNHSTK